MSAEKIRMEEKAYCLLLEKIVSLQLAPGVAVSDHLLSGQLGMSRTPIRTALARLQQEGLVECVDKKLRVAAIGMEDIRQLYQARIAVEEMAAELICSGEGLPQKIAVEMEHEVQALEQCVLEKDLRGNYLADEKFHQLLLEASGNKRLAGFFRALNHQMIRMRYLTVGTPDIFRRTVQEHRKILQFLKEGQQAKAKNQIRRHLLRAVENYETIFSCMKVQ